MQIENIAVNPQHFTAMGVSPDTATPAHALAAALASMADAAPITPGAKTLIHRQLKDIAKRMSPVQR